MKIGERPSKMSIQRHIRKEKKTKITQDGSCAEHTTNTTNIVLAQYTCA